MAKAFSAALRAGVCALAVAAAAPAQAESLADALSLAYQTNPNLQGQRAQLRVIDEQLVQARAGYRPEVSVSASGTFNWTRLGRDACTTFACDRSPEENDLSANLQVTQPLFTGGRVSAQVRGAQADILAAREDLREVEGQVMLSVIRAYIDVRRDEQNLAIRRENVAVLQRQVDETRARFEVGEVTRTDVAQSEAELAFAQSQLSQAQAQLANSRAIYATAVGQSPGQLEPEPAFKVFPETVDQAFETALQNNPSIRAAEYAEQAAAAQVAAARAERLPNIGLQASYGYNQPINPFDSDLNRRSLTAGVSGSVPLFSGGVISSRIRQAVEQENIARIRRELARREAVETVSQAWNTLLAARANIAAGEEQVRAARIAFEGARAEQQVGLRTTLEVLNAQQVLRDAELALVSARRDEYLASASVLNVMGLLEARNLVAGLEDQPGGHSLRQLRSTSTVPVLEHVAEALDSVASSPSVDMKPAPVDAPITTGRTPDPAS